MVPWHMFIRFSSYTPSPSCNPCQSCKTVGIALATVGFLLPTQPDMGVQVSTDQANAKALSTVRRWLFGIRTRTVRDIS